MGKDVHGKAGETMVPIGVSDRVRGQDEFYPSGNTLILTCYNTKIKIPDINTRSLGGDGETWDGLDIPSLEYLE